MSDDGGMITDDDKDRRPSFDDKVESDDEN